MGQPTHVDALRAASINVIAAVTASRALSDAAISRFLATADRFVAFCGRGHGLFALHQVTPGVVDAFIRAPSEGHPVGVARMHSRRTVLRTFFRFARELGLMDGDPSLDIRLPAKSELLTRPLTDDEVGLCRSYALTSLQQTRHAAVWALAETTARSAEIPHIRACDVDLEAGKVWIHGGSRTPERWGDLSAWGATQIARRIDAMNCDNMPLVYSGRRGGESAQASSSMAIADALARAGLDRESDVRPLSITAWAGCKILERTGRIEDVAKRLGMRSLDRAALLIGWDWQTSIDSA
jgi:site-specific recombinase XerD